MRNLKKVLSLTLALVMLLGMMVVGAGAATEYKDEATITYKEAADVLNAINVIKGRDDGNFDPKTELNRAEGAAIIYRLIMGGVDKDPAPVTTGFTDVDGNAEFSWASGYIAACAEQQILSGTGNNMFEPAEKLEGAAFAKMLLVALGYKASVQGYTGNSWASNVARDARTRGILVSGVNLNSSLTREQAAQMTLQTLTAEIVEQEDAISINGVTIPGKKAETVKHTTGDKLYDSTTPSDGTQTWKYCEITFPNLKLTTGGDTTDSFGRPANVWKLGKDEITTASKSTAVVTYNSLKTPAQVTADLKSYDLAASVVTVNVGAGSISAINEKSDIAGATQNGVIVEVYTDSEGDIDRVVRIQKSVAVLSADPVVKNDKVTISAIGMVGAKVEDVEGYEDLAKDDVVLYVRDQDNGWHIEKADVLENVTVTGYKGTKAIIDGANYDPSFLNTGKYDGSSSDKKVTDDKTYNIYMDNAGCIVLAKVVSGEEAPAQLAVLQEVAVVDGDTSGAIGADASKWVQARLVFTDGTSKVGKIASIDGVKFVTKSTALDTLGSHAVKKTTLDDAKAFVGKTFASADSAGVVSGVDSGEAAAKAYYAVADGATAKVKGVYFGIDETADLTTTTTNPFTLKHFYTYTEKDGVFTLKSVPSSVGTNTALAAAQIKNGETKITNKNGVLGNANTVFILAVKEGGSTVYKTYTGIKNVPTSKAAVATTDTALVKGATASYVYADLTGSSNGITGTESGDLVYVLNNGFVKNNTNPATYTYEVLFNGEETTLTLDDTATVNKLYNAGTVKDGVYTLGAEVTAVTGDGIKSVTGNTLAVGTNDAFDYDEGAIAYVIDRIDGKDVVDTTTIEALTLDGNDTVVVKTVAGNANKAEVVYVTKVTNEADNVTLAAATTSSLGATGDLTSGTITKDGYNASSAKNVKLTITVAAGTSVKSVALNSNEITGVSDWSVGKDDLTVSVGDNVFTVVIEDENGGPDTSWSYTLTVTE